MEDRRRETNRAVVRLPSSVQNQEGSSAELYQEYRVCALRPARILLVTQIPGKETRMRIPSLPRRTWLVVVPLVVLLIAVFLATSDNSAIWPVRNTLIYRLDRWWSGNSSRSPARRSSWPSATVRSTRPAPTRAGATA